MRIAALIVAAGRGSRTGLNSPKQYANLNQKTVLAHALDVFSLHPSVDLVQVVVHPEDTALYAKTVCSLSSTEKVLSSLHGGQTRQESVLLGLEGLSTHHPDIVLIHDAARPFVTKEVIDTVLGALKRARAVVPALKVKDTLKKADPEGGILGTIPREHLWLAQTPQGFYYDDILSAHRKAASLHLHEFTDDSALAEWAKISVRVVEGTSENSKITTAQDLIDAHKKIEHLMSKNMQPRIGTGFDVHRFTSGHSVWLCGVEIPHSQSLEGHSDADVGLHALTDALLGAIGDGDIGLHFPPSDPQWKGAASHLFLSDAARRVRIKGGSIVNVDVTLLCEEPRIGPHRTAMQNRIAQILSISVDRIGIKATTTEGLGFTGRREGIACLATALVLPPFSSDL
ncbi:MAG: bifunctional 2-C-methyl-D-erythritol 4-phosphate cytidylyltransferase/2-C-methyl-D-erythritol 2,4-cyclodiphosphate synthase [Hyphomicrobium sp.]